MVLLRPISRCKGYISTGRADVFIHVPWDLETNYSVCMTIFKKIRVLYLTVQKYNHIDHVGTFRAQDLFGASGVFGFLPLP